MVDETGALSFFASPLPHIEYNGVFHESSAHKQIRLSLLGLGLLLSNDLLGLALLYFVDGILVLLFGQFLINHL